MDEGRRTLLRQKGFHAALHHVDLVQLNQFCLNPSYLLKGMATSWCVIFLNDSIGRSSVPLLHEVVSFSIDVTNSQKS